jgi:flagellar export protein FliJ
MKFRFPYKKLMEVRKREEEIAMRDFLEARSLLDQANATLRSMYDSIDEARSKAVSTAHQGGAISQQLEVIDQFIKGQKFRILKQREQVRSLLTLVEQKQEVLVKAAQEYKILEKLKEKLLLAHQQKVARIEVKEIDDLVVMRHQRER